MEAMKYASIQADGVVSARNNRSIRLCCTKSSTLLKSLQSHAAVISFACEPER